MNVLTDKDDTVTVEHFGTHTHWRPPPVKTDQAGRKELREAVLQNPEFGPEKLALGSDDGKPADKMHPSLVNRGVYWSSKKADFEGS